MKNNKKKAIIITIVALLLAAAVAVAVWFVSAKKKSDAPAEETTASSTEASSKPTQDVNADKTDKTDELKEPENIVFSGVHEGIYTVGNVDYVSDLKGIHKITKDGKTTLTNQNTGNRFNIINDVIYYTVKDKAEPFETDMVTDGTKVYWVKSSCWTMNLDGSNQKKLFDYSGCGYVVYADDTCIIYADDGKPGIYTDGYESFLYRYNISDGTTKLIDRGEEHDIVDGKDYEYYNSVEQFTYVNGYIFYQRFNGVGLSCDPREAYIYNVKNDTRVEIGERTVKIFPADEYSVYLITAEIKSGGGSDKYNYKICKYDSRNNKVTVLKDFGETDMLVFEIYETGTKNLSYLAVEKNEKYLYFKCNGTTVTEMTADEFKSSTPTFEEPNIVKYENGKKVILGTSAWNKDDNRSWSWAYHREFGANCALAYDYDQNEPLYTENPTTYNLCELIIYK